MRTLRQKRQKLYYLSTHWSNFGGNAMELSILSSYSLCYSIINGGNTGVLKHASNVQGCAFAIEDALRQDFRGVFMNLNVESKEVKTLIENKILPRSR
jgi:hypothetical protein